ncbi:MAG TPA: ABC transporter ATP-binding protein [Acidimicrobiales bacterium]|nr:ABC transporter ATP-binding protein [Acidimicrobiales bacterium]
MVNDANSKFNLDEMFLPVKQKQLRRVPRLIRVAFRIVWRAAPREFAFLALVQFIVGVGVALQLLAGRKVLAEVLASGDEGRFGDVLPSVILLAVVTAIVAFANLARVERQRILSELVGRYATNRVLDVSTAVDLLAYESPAFHDRLQRAQVNAATRPLQMVNGVLGVLGALFTIAGIAGALLFLEPLFLLLVLVAYIPVWFAATRASKVVYDFSVVQTERDRRRSYLFHIMTRKEEATEVRSFGLFDFLRQRYDRLYDEKIAELRGVVRRRLVLGLLGGLLTSFLTAGTIALLVWFVTSGRMPLSEAGAAAAAIVLLGQRLQALSGSAGSLYEGGLFMEDFINFVDALPALRATLPTGVPPHSFSTLDVEDVSFTYPSRSEPSLRGVSLTINRGEVVALVGENGSGKTTLAKILAGLYSPQLGQVTWDGVDLATCDPELVRDTVAVIFQDFTRYHLSAAENIGIGRHERYDDRAGIVAAACQAGADSYVSALDQGYDTKLGPQFFGGSDLSVGQWQRVALARAFFRDTPFIILDEPTAALDARAEYELFERIRELGAGRTVLLISHRFSSVRSADRIYVLDGGVIVEEGNHVDLMARRGLYAELFTLQAAAYADDDPRPSDSIGSR